MITPDSEEAFVIKDCINAKRSFRVGARGICVDLFATKDKKGWLMRIPRAGVISLNCDTVHYDTKGNSLIAGVECGYVASIEISMFMYDTVRVIG